MDALAIYLRDIGRRRVLLTRREEAALHRKAKRGDQVAREKLIHSQLPWAVMRAKRHKGLPLEDLIQIANLAVLKAVDKFDPRRGRLTTLVAWVVTQHLCRAIVEQGQVVHVPTHALKGPYRPEAEAAMAAMVSIGNSDRFRSHGHSDGDGGDDLWDIDARQEPDQDEAIDQAERRRRVQAAMDCLPPREHYVLEQRLQGRILDSIAVEIGTTRERVRQLQAKATDRLIKYLAIKVPS